MYPEPRAVPGSPQQAARQCLAFRTALSRQRPTGLAYSIGAMKKDSRTISPFSTS